MGLRADECITKIFLRQKFVFIVTKASLFTFSGAYRGASSIDISGASQYLHKAQQYSMLLWSMAWFWRSCRSDYDTSDWASIDSKPPGSDSENHTVEWKLFCFVFPLHLTWGKSGGHFQAHALCKGDRALSSSLRSDTATSVFRVVKVDSFAQGFLQERRKRHRFSQMNASQQQILIKGNLKLPGGPNDFPNISSSPCVVK